MRIHVISDLHGATWHLAEAAKDCDALVVLGDLLNVLDYHTMDGILVELYGREPVAEAAGLRARGLFDEARSVMRRLRRDDHEMRARFVELASEQYERVFEVLPDTTYLTYGNVDIPDLLRSYLRPGMTFLDGDVVEFDGERWGVVGGGLRTPLRIPGEVEQEEFDRKLAAIGAVDVICTHQPPRIPWLVYDVLGKRFEPGSTGLVGYIREHQPGRAYFGHVHQPLADRMTIGRSRLHNVGHFRGTGRPWVHETTA